MRVDVGEVVRWVDVGEGLMWCVGDVGVVELVRLGGAGLDGEAWGWVG